MKILHVSDLHLGRSFHGRSLFEDQEAILEEILRLCRTEGIGAVLVAGDVYDQANPRTDVVQQLSRFLAGLVDLGVEVVLTSGNHDSAARLGFGAEIFSRAGVHVRTRFEEAAEPVELSDGTLVYGIPFLEPRAAGPVLGTPRTHAAVLEAVMDRVRADLEERRSAAPEGTALRSVVMAHCFAVGGAASESERILESGTLGSVPVGTFAGPDYAALGHLHRRQRVAESVRYSGSPLPFSFSEADQAKGYWLLEPSETGWSVTGGEWEHRLGLARLTGRLEELLADPGLQWVEDRLVRVVLTDPRRPAHAMERLRTRFPHTLQLAFEHESTAVRRPYAERLAAVRGPEETCAAFFDQVRDRPLDAEEEQEVAAAVDAARHRLQEDETGPGSGTPASSTTSGARA